MNDSTNEMAPLTSDLAAAARSLDIPPGDPAAAVRRGGRRRQRQRRGLTGLAVLALVATVAGAVAVLDNPSAEIKVATSAGLSRGEVGVSWRAVSPNSGLGYSANLDTSAPLYALSTAAGQKDLKDGVPRVLWRSDDGIEWTAVSSAISDLFLSDLAGTDDRVYAVGTGPASAALAGGGRPVAPLMVGWSDDGAKTWDKARLPIDLESLAGKMLRLTVMSPQVVSTSKGTVIAGVLDGAVNVPALLPQGVTAPNGWATTAAGVDVLGPEKDSVCPVGSVTPEKLKANVSQEVRAVTGDAEKVGEVYPTTCIPENVDLSAVTRDKLVQVSPQDARGVVASYTWAQLGVEGDMLAAVRRQPVVFVAGSGSTDFSRVDLPALDPVNGPVLLDAGDGGFDMVATTSTSTSFKAMEGVQVVQLHSADGRSWTASPANAGTVWATAAGRVAGTPTIVGQSPEGASVLRSADGGWTSTSLSSILSDSPPGDRVSLMSAAIGPFGIVATVAVTPEAPVDKANLDRPVPMDQRVLVSRDGATWQEFKVDDLAGRPVRNVIRSAVVGNRAVVTVSVKPDAGDGSAQLVLVGTPT